MKTKTKLIQAIIKADALPSDVLEVFVEMFGEVMSEDDDTMRHLRQILATIETLKKVQL